MPPVRNQNSLCQKTKLIHSFLLRKAKGTAPNNETENQNFLFYLRILIVTQMHNKQLEPSNQQPYVHGFKQ